MLSSRSTRSNPTLVRLASVAVATAALAATLASPTLAQAAGDDDRVTALEQRLGKMETTLEQIQKDQKQIINALNRVEKSMVAPRGRPPEPSGPVEIPLSDSPIKGDAKGAVTIVEFSDFQCPYCSRVQPLLEEVLDGYPKGVRLVFKQFPLTMHPQARPAAIAALAAHEQGKFWEMHDELFANARQLSPAFFEKTAEKLGLDVDRFKKDMERTDLATQVNTEMTQGRNAGVTGTPTLFVNGMKVQSRSVPGIKAMIDAELEKAKGAKKKG